MEKVNNTNNNCRFCLRIFDELEERIGITSQLSDEFRNITQTEVQSKQKTIFLDLIRNRATRDGWEPNSSVSDGDERLQALFGC